MSSPQCWRDYPKLPRWRDGVRARRRRHGPRGRPRRPVRRTVPAPAGIACGHHPAPRAHVGGPSARHTRPTGRSARMSGGLLRATRASKRVGAGLEFADHRDYAAGDDLRYLDWNLYGRLGRLALGLFPEEEDPPVEVLVDASASMGVGNPAKLDLALQIGAALAYVGLANLDRVALSPLGDDAAPRRARA